MQIIEERFATEFHLQSEELREETTHGNLLALCNDENFKQIKQQILANSGTMGQWITDYLRDVSKFLSRTAAYWNKNTELHLQAQRDLLQLLFAFNHQNYSRYLKCHHFE